MWRRTDGYGGAIRLRHAILLGGDWRGPEGWCARCRNCGNRRRRGTGRGRKTRFGNGRLLNIRGSVGRRRRVRACGLSDLSAIIGRRLWGRGLLNRIGARRRSSSSGSSRLRGRVGLRSGRLVGALPADNELLIVVALSDIGWAWSAPALRVGGYWSWLGRGTFVRVATDFMANRLWRELRLSGRGRTFEIEVDVDLIVVGDKTRWRRNTIRLSLNRMLGVCRCNLAWLCRYAEWCQRGAGRREEGDGCPVVSTVRLKRTR